MKTIPNRFLRVSTLLAVIMALLPGCNKNQGGSENEEPEDPKEHKVVVLSKTERPAVKKVTDDGTVVFAGTEMANKLAPGSVIVSEPSENAPYGFLYKVKSVKTKEGTTIISTEQACLEDAIENCHVDESFDLNNKIEYIEFGDGTIARPKKTAETKITGEVSKGFKLPFKVSVKGDKVFFRSDPSEFEVIETDSNDENIEVIEYVGDDIKGTASVAAELGITIEAMLTLGIELDVKDWNVDHFALWVEPEFKCTVDAGFVMEGKMEFKDIRIGKLGLAPITVWAGIVPVVITPSIGLYADITASGKIKVKTKLLDLDFKYKFGVDFSDGKWSSIDENTSKKPSFLELDKNFKATLEGELEVTPTRITVIPGLYNCDSEQNIYAGVALPFRFSVTNIDVGDMLSDYYVNPTIKATWSIEPKVKVKLTVLKHDLVDFTPELSDFAKFTLFERNIFPVMTDLSLTNVSSTSVTANFSLTNLPESLLRRFDGIGVLYSSVASGASSLQLFKDNVSHVPLGGTGLYWDEDDAEENINVSLLVKDLAPGTEYHIRPYFNTILGTKYGRITKHITGENTLRAITGDVTDITENSAKLSATYEAGLDGAVTERGFCLSSTETVPKVDNSQKFVIAAGQQTYTVTGLSSNTKYYVRAFATNSLGTVYGNVVEFTTPEEKKPAIKVSHTVLDFGSIKKGEKAREYFTISNIGSADLTVKLTKATDAFSIDWTSATITPGAEKKVYVTFAPDKVGDFSSAIKIESNADSGNQKVTLRGKATTDVEQVAKIELSKSELNFGEVKVGESGTLNVGVKNTGTADLKVSVSGAPSSVSLTWKEATIAPNTSKSLSVTYTPKEVSELSSVLKFTSNATNGTKTVNLSGKGVSGSDNTAFPVISLSAESLDFGNVTVGESGKKVITISNTGNKVLTVRKISFPSGYTGDWSSGSIASGSSKVLNLTFRPTVAQSYNGNLTIESDASNGDQVIPLSGTGEGGSSSTAEYVDLGLSVKWATCNLGATKPEEYGNYYAWGETEPKSEYNWSTYKWGNEENDLTKYCTQAGYGRDGFTDNKTVLDLEDDAAHVALGGTWRMPTKTEQDELRERCNWEWTSVNGVNGQKVTGPNGNSIFLPAAGRRFDSSLYYAGSDGEYWSSSLSTDGPYYAFYIDFDSGYVSWYNCRRYSGQSVRPVTE